MKPTAKLNLSLRDRKWHKKARKFLNALLNLTLSIFILTACQNTEKPNTDGEAKKDESSKTDEGKQADGKIDRVSLFPKDSGYYNYKGSLTAPPCSEVVNWYVMKKPVTASKEQIESFAKILDGNYRSGMPLEGREVSSFGE